MDDTQTIVAKLAAEQKIQGWLDEFLPVLIVRCKSRELDIYIHTGTQSEVEYNTDQTTVNLRFDDLPAIAVKTNHSTDGEALFFQEVQDMFKILLMAKTMLFEFTPFNAAPAVTTFDVHGFKEAVEPMQQPCNFKIS